MSTTNSPPERAAAVMSFLRSLRNNSGAMANLRCAVSSARRHRAWPLLARIGGIDEPVIEAVCGLFAYHPDEISTGNFGDTCCRIAGMKNSFDARFRRLLACAREELCERIRPVAFADKTKGIPVNYQTLLEDL